MTQQIHRRNVIQATGMIFGLGIADTSSANQRKTQSVQSPSISNRLLSDLTVENNGDSGQTIHVAFLKNGTRIFNEVYTVDPGERMEKTSILPDVRQLSLTDDYAVSAQVDGGTEVTNSADIVAIYPDLYGMVAEIHDDNELYVYDSHVDPFGIDVGLGV